MLNHPTEEQLALYADSQLMGAGHDEVEHHLAKCPECAREVAMSLAMHQMEEAGLLKALTPGEANSLRAKLRVPWATKIQIIWDGAKGRLKRAASSSGSSSGPLSFAAAGGILGAELRGLTAQAHPHLSGHRDHGDGHSALSLENAPGSPTVRLVGDKLVLAFSHHHPDHIHLHAGDVSIDREVPPSGIVEIPLAGINSLSAPGELRLEIFDRDDGVRFHHLTPSMIIEGQIGHTENANDNMTEHFMAPPPSAHIQPANPIFGTPDQDAARTPEAYQGYSDTCAIRSQQIILAQFGVSLPQEQLMLEAREHQWYKPGHGTTLDNVGNLLELHGVPVHRYNAANVFNLASELAQGHKVIVGVASGELWQQNPILAEINRFLGISHSADHALIVTGIDTSNPDHVMVDVMDPGTGDVCKQYPLEQFLDAWKGSDFFMTATQNPAPAWLPEMRHFNYGVGHIEQIGHLPYHECEHFFAVSHPALGQIHEFLASVVGTSASLRHEQTSTGDMAHGLGHSHHADQHSAADTDSSAWPDAPLHDSDLNSDQGYPLDDHHHDPGADDLP